MKTSKIIILNAPPASGKDTIANMLIAQSLVDCAASFKKPMFDIAEATLGEKKFAKFMELYNNRETKELPADILNGKSPREFLIAISEDFVKPVLGESYFGDYMADYISEIGGDVVVSDGGFDAEVVPLVKHGHDVRIVKLFRDGFDFKGDSRTYINAPDGALSVSLKLIDGLPQDAVDMIAHLCKLSPRSDI